MKTINPTIQLSVNGETFKVDRDLDANTRLVDFLRRSAFKTGTKVMCREGGCGACVVTLTSTDPVDGKKEARAVNSCLLPLLSCDGCEITTVEGIGNMKNGLHPIQAQLADMNGTQCGFCSPGMVMSAYSMIERKAGNGITMKDVETALDGNICRCTGYRPIMDAFKTFAKDAPPELKSQCVDLEDLGRCPKTGGACSGVCSNGSIKNGNGNSSEVIQIGSTWYRPNSLNQLMGVMKSFNPDAKYRLVAGNTGTGVYKNDGPFEVYVDVSRIGELYQVTKSTPLTIGGGTTLTHLMELFEKIGAENPDYWYAPILAEHIGKIGSTPIRNLGSVAGNLMLMHSHNEFPSDVFICLETVGAKLNLINRNGEKQQLSLTDFLRTDMKGQIIVNFTLPPLTKDHVIKTYKIMPRSVNAHAYINAGFRARIQGNKIIEKPTIIYGGIHPSSIHAAKTEEFLTGKNIGDELEFKSAIKILDQELLPQKEWLNPEPSYLKTVAHGLLYKFVLNIVGKQVDAKNQSGMNNLERGVSSGKQEFDTDANEWPIRQPIIKLEARAQCSGEAQYTDDIPLLPGELHAAFVLSTVANCQLDSIDPSKALKAEGVVAYYDAKNIKYGNKFVIAGKSFCATDDEEIFSSGSVKYAGQALGLIVARSQMEAIRAAKLVQVKYKGMQTPVLTIKEALKHPDRITDHVDLGPINANDVGNVEEGWASSETIVEGEFEVGAQYHFYMETLTAACAPTEDGMNVYCTTQDQDDAHRIISECLNLKKSQVNMQTRRIGGGFGGKASRLTQVAAACAIAAAELSKPVRIQLDLESNMALAGGRMPYYCKYKAGVDKNGLLQAVDMHILCDCGSNFNEGGAFLAAYHAKSCYASKSWKFLPQVVRTDTHSNTYMRAPGTSQGVAFIENLMEHLAKVLKEDPLEFRIKNMNTNDKDVLALIKLIEELRQSSDYDDRHRQVEEFNRNNRWRKRGINLLPMVYPIHYPPFRYNILVAILHDGGSIAVSHGGIEMGQGINTKVTQVVARELGVDVSLVSIKPTNVLTNANGSATGGSIGSELNCYAALKACQELKERMRPIKEKMPDANWAALVEACYNSNVDLIARYYYTPDDNVQTYAIHSATVSEVEVDVLTGEQVIRRVDLVEDAGESINPMVDIGQVEGAFVMGIGLWTSEKYSYDPISGQKLSLNTWNYKPPLNSDIPVDFRVTLLKNAGHPLGVLRSKATGEPPLAMSASVFFALKNAVNAARSDAGNPDWFPMDGPATVDKLHKMMSNNPKYFNFN